MHTVFFLRLVAKVRIESVEDLKKILKDNGYSKKAIIEILAWYA